MLGITSIASIMTIVGGLGIQMNAYLADAKSTQLRNADEIRIEADLPQTLAVHVQEYFADMPILAEIANCESTFRQFDSKGKVIRGIADSNDVGVMQINERYHLAQSKKLGYNIYTLDGNMAYARYLYETEGTKPWNASKACWQTAAKNLPILAEK